MKISKIEKTFDISEDDLSLNIRESSTFNEITITQETRGGSGSDYDSRIVNSIRIPKTKIKKLFEDILKRLETLEEDEKHMERATPHT